MPHINHLKNVEPFNKLPSEVFDILRKECLVKTYTEDYLLFSIHDDPTGYLYFINKGLVEIFSETNEGVEIPVDYRHDGEFFGWTPIFTSSGYAAGAKTINLTECLLIPKQLVLEISKQYPVISNFFNKAVLSRIRKLYQDVVKRHNIDHSMHIEAYPFQKKISEIMTSNPVTCLETSTAGEIATVMTQKSISSVLVTDSEDNLTGIVTERDLVTKILGTGNDVCLKNKHAKEFMTTKPYMMSENSYMYEAAAFMLSHNIRHLPIVNENDKIVGVISIRDLMKFRSQKSVILIGKAKEAENYEALIIVKKELTSVAKVLLMENRSHVETMEIISYIHHTVIKRCFELVMHEMTKEGYEVPNIKYCFMIMGSGGRKEMLLGPDQDNGFIFEDYPDEMQKDVDDFFIPFSERLTKRLDYVGYYLCKGNVMVSNPDWRGKISEWKNRVSSWINIPEPQRVRYSSIFFDLAPLCGEVSLLSSLKEHILNSIKANPIFLFHMMELDFKHKVPLGLLNRFITSDDEHKGELSVKENGSIFIVDCTRMYMLEHKLYANTTLERIDLLVERDVFNTATAEQIKAAFEYFTYIRLKNEIELIDKGEKPTHYLDPYVLPKNEQDLLKEAFKVADKLQDSTKRHFGKLVGL